MGEADGREAGKKEAKTGHTPGPWYANMEQGTVAGGPDMRLVARTAHWHRNDKFPTSSEANARLIAAAPDMLEALERLVELGFPDGAYSDEEGEAWENVEKAIQKARSEVKGEG